MLLYAACRELSYQTTRLLLLLLLNLSERARTQSSNAPEKHYRCFSFLISISFFMSINAEDISGVPALLGPSAFAAAGW